VVGSADRCTVPATSRNPARATSQPSPAELPTPHHLTGAAAQHQGEQQPADQQRLHHRECTQVQRVYLQTEAQHVGADATLPQGVGQGGADEPAQRPGAEVLCVGVPGPR